MVNQYFVNILSPVFVNHRKGKNDLQNDSMIGLQESYVAELGSAVRIDTDCSLEHGPAVFRYISGKSNILVQNLMKINTVISMDRILCRYNHVLVCCLCNVSMSFMISITSIASSENVSKCRFKLSCACAKYDLGIRSQFVHSVISNDSVSGQ